MNNLRRQELLGESIWNTYSDMAYLIVEGRLKTAGRTAALVGLGLLSTQRVPPEPHRGTDLEQSIDDYEERRNPGTVHPFDKTGKPNPIAHKRFKADAKLRRDQVRYTKAKSQISGVRDAWITNRDKGETPEQQIKRYGVHDGLHGPKGTPLSRAEHLKSLELVKKIKALRDRGPR